MSKHNQNNHQEAPKQTKGQNEAQADEAQVFDNVPEADSEDQTAEDIENAEMSEIDKLAAELGETKGKLEAEKKEYMYLMAEFDNYRKRTLREKQELISNASEKVLRDLLPIVDDFERGLAATKDSEDVANIREGMQLIYNKLMKYLEQHGVKPIESNGVTFDPELHDALTMVPAQDESQKGKVIDTPTRGYMLNDKVLRHAKVVVAQ